LSDLSDLVPFYGIRLKSSINRATTDKTSLIGAFYNQIVTFYNKGTSELFIFLPKAGKIYQEW
jgi:type III secretory pathway component EscT